MDQELVLGDLRFQVRRSDQRRVLEITVDRDGALVLSAPRDAPAAKLQDFALRKRMWVYRQLARREALAQPVRLKQFVDGEGFAYLGRQHRLKLVASGDVPVKLQGGRFVMPKSAVLQGRAHMIAWYGEHARAWLQHRVADFAARMEVLPAGVRVQDLGYRWGSCGKGGLLYFHWKTILLPAPIAEYVVMHEMAHLHEPHHTPEFWRRVERAMPDYLRRKDVLDAKGAEVEGL